MVSFLTRETSRRRYTQNGFMFLPAAASAPLLTCVFLFVLLSPLFVSTNLGR